MSTGLRALLTLAAFVVVAAGMKAAQAILVPFLFAAFLAIICTPLLDWLIRHRLPAGLALLLVILGMVAACVGVVLLLGSSINDFQENFDQYKPLLQRKIAAAVGWLKSIGITVPDRVQQDSLNTDQAFAMIGQLLSNLAELIGNGLFVLFYLVFMLTEAAGFTDKLAALPGDKQSRDERWQSIVADIRHYLALKTVISLGTGLAVGIILFLLEIPYSPLWGLLAFLLNYIPNFGSFIAAGPPVLLAWITKDVSTVLWVIATFVAINVVAGNVIEPRVMGRGLGLSALVVLISLVFWGFILGLVGMLLSVPLTIIAKIILSGSHETRWIAILLSAEAPAAAGASPAPGNDSGQK